MCGQNKMQVNSPTLISAIISCMFCVSCAQEKTPQPISEKTESSTGEIFDLDSDDMRVLSVQAERGDNVSLDRIVMYYMLGPQSHQLNENDRKDLLRWMRVGAARNISGYSHNLLNLSAEFNLTCKEIKELARDVTLEEINSIKFDNPKIRKCL
jgi:hypothetical protein